VKLVVSETLVLIANVKYFKNGSVTKTNQVDDLEFPGELISSQVVLSVDTETN